jgi:hypothetical protein
MVVAIVPSRMPSARCDNNGALEERWIERVQEATGEVRAIFVDDADRQIFRFRRGAGRNRIDRKAEGIGDQKQHHRVGADAYQLFQG